MTSDADIDKTARYSVARTALNDKKQSFIIYISGSEWCGTGGCVALVVMPEGKSFRVINRFTLARLPIQVLPTKTHGWHDLTMPVAGGGMNVPRTALLKFNGKKYPSNPSTAPSARRADLVGGKTLPLKNIGELVF